jgi:hypothetical protein
MRRGCGDGLRQEERATYKEPDRKAGFGDRKRKSGSLRDQKD